jgi:PKD repeat protein
LRVKIHPPRYNYPGSNRNGVQSGSYSYWLGSYEIIGRAPSVVEFPASQARMVGGTAFFSVQATGQGTLRYQWSHNSNSLNGATNSSLQIPVTSINQAGCYSVAITDDNATVVHTAQLVVLPFAAGAPAAEPGSLAGLSPGGFTSVLVTGNTNAGTIYGNGFYSDWSDVSAAAVHAGLVAHGQQGVVLVARLQSQTRFFGGMGAAVESVAWSSGAGYALLGRAPHIVESPLSQIVLAGKSGRLSFQSTDRDNPNFRIQWRRDGEPLMGATGETLQVSAASPGERVRYDVVLSIPGAPSVSLPATVVTPPSTAKFFTVNTAAEAGQYLRQEGNLVYVPVQGTISGGSIWGTGVYTSDSHLGMAAVHAGLVTPGETGQIAIYTVGSWSGFMGTTRNGVESRAYSAYSGIVLGSPSPAPLQPSIRPTGTGQFLIEGAAGKTCHVLASPTMAPGSWLLLETRKVSSDSELWTDPTVPLPRVRFYRLLLP